MEIARLKHAIDEDDVETVKVLLTGDPALHAAPMGYGNDGPLTWVAECRVPRQAPSPQRLAMAEWMIQHGSDVHQGGDGPLMRAALDGERIPMMELLATHGADVNARWHGSFPILFAACEAVDPQSLEWLLNHGAKPGEALDYLLGTYVRAPVRLSACIDLLIKFDAVTKYDFPGVLIILRNDIRTLSDLLNSDPGLVSRRFSELDFGTTGGRSLTLRGATLLHVAAEFQNIEACELLLDKGADVNAQSQIDEDRIGGQTALFHAATQVDDVGLPVVQLLLGNGATPHARARVPGHYENPDEVIECSATLYAERFAVPDGKVVQLLRRKAAQ
jgi:ankyrin repeat protein